MINNWQRNVIPKWRKSTVAATLPETHAPALVKKTPYKPEINLDFINRELLSWRENRSVGVAADLLNLCHIDGLSPLLQEPAKYILQSEGQLPESLLLIANRVLGGLPDSKDTAGSKTSNPDQVFTEIANLKRRLTYNPRDAVTLVDLARLYASLGQKEKANRAISIATSIYPDHRFILRSSIRHWIHAGEPEKGLFLLKNTERTNNDPWLLASELAVESVLKKAPKRWKLAKAMLASDRFNPTHITELASASAAIYLTDGNIKDSKRMFNKALLAPNDNTIAQAIWASEYFGIQINTRPEWFQGEFSAEAKYYKRQSNLDFNGAIQAALEWFYSEPFSLRPIRAATYAAAIIGNYIDSESYSRLGLKIDKMDVELRNNLVYALACQGKLDEAQSQLLDVINNEKNLTGKNSYHTIANLALLQYRYGNIKEGEGLYRRALSMIDDGSNAESKALATVTMAKEALLANAPNSLELLEEAKKITLSSKASGAIKMIESLTTIDVDRPKRIELQVPTWLHDKSTNTLLISEAQPFKVR